MSSPSDGTYSSLSAAHALARDPLGRSTVNLYQRYKWKGQLGSTELQISISFLIHLLSDSSFLQDVSVSFHLLELDTV